MELHFETHACLCPEHDKETFIVGVIQKTQRSRVMPRWTHTGWEDLESREDL